MIRVDVIVAVCNEEQNIPLFVTKIDALTLPEQVDLRVIFVEDSSTDGTRALLRRLCRENSRVSYYTLARGFGQGAAITFGLSRSQADAMIMLDVDGSHPIEVIPEMIRGLLAGADVVQCIRRSLTNRRTHRRLGATLYHYGAKLLTGSDPHEQNIFYRLVRRSTARFILENPRYWRYLRFPLPRQPPGILRFIEVDTYERLLGESKYNFWRLLNLAIDGVLSQIPTLRLASLLMTGAALAATALYVGCWPVAILLAAGLLLLMMRFRSLLRSDLLERIQVSECSDPTASHANNVGAGLSENAEQDGGNRWS